MTEATLAQALKDYPPGSIVEVEGKRYVVPEPGTALPQEEDPRIAAHKAQQLPGAAELLEGTTPQQEQAAAQQGGCCGAPPTPSGMPKF